MDIYTTWVSYNGLVGITKDGDYYELNTGLQMFKEVHQGSLYYRAFKSKKRYSYKKCNETKILKAVKIIEIPF
jgi:hypothetical protein